MKFKVYSLETMWRLAIFLCMFITSAIHPVPIRRINMPATNRWDGVSQSLYWANLFPNGTEPLFFRWDWASGKLYGGYIKGVDSVCFIDDIEEDSKEIIKTFAVGIGKDIVKIRWDGESKWAYKVETLASNLDKDNDQSSVFYAKVDPFGRLSVGTGAVGLCNGSESGHEGVYNFGLNGLQQVVSGVTVSAATNFHVPSRTMFQLASCLFKIYAYDWNESTGAVSNRRTVFDVGSLPNYNPKFDIAFEMTMDSDGILYVTMQSGRILVIDPWTKKLIGIIQMPVKGLGGLIFGGPQRKTLYVLAGQRIIDFTVGPDTTKFTPGETSLFAITGLKARGPNVSRVIIN